MKNIFLKKEGQTLIILLIYMEIAIIITTAAITAVVTNALGTDKVYQGTVTVDTAESGAETAMIKLLRDPDYSGEQSFNVGGGTVKIEKTGSNPYVFVSTGKSGNFIRKIQITVEYQNDAFTIIDQREIF